MSAILIVEDDQNQRLLLQEELEDEGYKTTAVSSALEALDTVADSMPDLVVVDLAMPGMDGVELLSKLLSMNNRLPVIIHTAFANYQDNFMTWAADAYVIKHHTFAELKTTVRRVLQERGGLAAAANNVTGTA